MVTVKFIQDYATKVAGEIESYDSMLASYLIQNGIAVLHQEMGPKSKFNPK